MSAFKAAATKQPIASATPEKLFVHADGATNYFAWITSLTKRAKSLFPKFELWKDVVGDSKPGFELQVLMETNLPLLPPEKQPSAAVKLQLLKDDIREAKIAQFSAVWAEVTEASKLRTLSRYGLDYRTAEDANDVSALMKLLAKVHLGQSQSNTELVIEHEDRLLKLRQSHKSIFDYNVLYKQVLEACAAAKLAADPAFVKATFLSNHVIITRYGDSLCDDFVDWRAKELQVHMAAALDLPAIMIHAESWWQLEMDRARKLGFSRVITSVSGMRSKEPKSEKVYYTSDAESAHSKSSHSSYRSASRSPRVMHKSRSKKVSSAGKSSGYASDSSVASSVSSKSMTRSKPSVRFSPAPIVKHTGDSPTSDPCAICKVARDNGVKHVVPWNHTTAECRLVSERRSSFQQSGRSKNKPRGRGRGSQPRSSQRSKSSGREASFFTTESDDCFNELLAFNAANEEPISGDYAFVTRERSAAICAAVDDDVPELVAGGSSDDEDDESLVLPATQQNVVLDSGATRDLSMFTSVAIRLVAPLADYVDESFITTQTLFSERSNGSVRVRLIPMSIVYPDDIIIVNDRERTVITHASNDSSANEQANSNQSPDDSANPNEHAFMVTEVDDDQASTDSPVLLVQPAQPSQLPAPLARLQRELHEDYAESMKPVDDIQQYIYPYSNTFWHCDRCTIQQTSLGHTECELCRYNPTLVMRELEPETAPRRSSYRVKRTLRPNNTTSYAPSSDSDSEQDSDSPDMTPAHLPLEANPVPDLPSVSETVTAASLEPVPSADPTPAYNPIYSDVDRVTVMPPGQMRAILSADVAGRPMEFGAVPPVFSRPPPTNQQVSIDDVHELSRSITRVRTLAQLMESVISTDDQDRIHAALCILESFMVSARQYLRSNGGGLPIEGARLRRHSAAEASAHRSSNVATSRRKPAKKKPRSEPPKPSSSASSSRHDPDDDADNGQACPALDASESSLVSKEMILDSGSTAHLFHMCMLYAFRNVRNLNRPKHFTGIDGGSITATMLADSTFFTDVHFSEQASQNLISLSKLEDAGYCITFAKGKATCVNEQSTLVFERRSNLYVLRQAFNTTSDSEPAAFNGEPDSETALVAAVVRDPQSWSKDQIKRACLYREMHVRAGHPGQSETLQCLRRGGYLGFPTVTVSDVALADKVLFPCEICLRSKSVHPVRLPKRELTTIIGHTQHVDYFYLSAAEGLRTFIIFVDEASNRVKVQSPVTRSAKFFETAFTAVNNFYVACSKSPIKIIVSDNEGSVKKFEKTFNSLGGTMIFRAAGDKVELAERYIQEIKTILRVLTVDLPYRFPSASLAYAVAEAEDILSSRSNPKTGGVPVGELVDGRKLDLSLLDVPYGSFGLAMTPKVYRDNSLTPKGHYGICIRRSHSRVRSFKVLLLLTPPRVVTRSHFQVLPISEDHTKLINALTDINLSPTEYIDSLFRGDSSTAEQGQHAEFPEGDEELVHPPIIDYESEPEPVTQPLSVTQSSEVADSYTPLQYPIPSSEAPAPSDPDPNTETVFDSGVPEQSDVGVSSPVSPPAKKPSKPKPVLPPRAPSSRKSIHPKDKDKDFVYAAKASNMSFKKADAKHGQVATDSGALEIGTILDRNVLVPVHYSDLSQKQRAEVIISFTFFKEKFLVSGELEKLKARLVAGGHMVDSQSLGDISSPTVKTESVFLLHALAARLGLHISCMDVTAAYLNTKLPEEQRIAMRLGPEETRVVIKLRPNWGKYVNSKDGTMLVLVVGGLYGLPQAALLWYDEFSSTLISLGYQPTVMDKCVFVKFNERGKRSFIAVHVDDAMHVYDCLQFQRELLEGLESKYGKLTVQSGDVGIYVGVEYSYNRSDKSVKLTMLKYLSKLLEDYQIKNTVDTPSPSNLMEYDGSLPKVDAKKYASLVMSIYYASLRVRPDTLFTVNYLSTRSKDATSHEFKCAVRLLKYFKKTLSVGLVLRPSGTTLHFYVDASFGIHPNGRSHSGSCVSLGGEYPSLGLDGAFFCRTAVQKFVTVSSTEAEMSAVYDLHQYIAFFRQLLSELGIDQTKPSLVLQDNAAAELNFTRVGGPRGRTMPLNVRYYYIVELIEDGVIRIAKIDTADMLADILTKPFSSREDLQLVQRLLNDASWMAYEDL